MNETSDNSDDDVKKLSSKPIQFWASRYSVVREAAQNLGWKVMEPSEQSKDSVNIIWVDSSNVNEYFASIRPWQMINHFPGMINIARKAELAMNLENMRSRFPDEFSFSPETFIIPRDMPALRNQFSVANGKSKNIFIVKPAGGSQGKGIFMTNQLKQIEGLTTTHVCQKYIMNPLLIDNKKFDLRIYVLITSCNPLRVYMHQDGLVRLCTEEYKRPTDENMDHKYMHLSNYSINKTSDKFDGEGNASGETGSKRSVKWLIEWIRSAKGKAVADELWKHIGHICLRTIISILPTLIREYNATFPEYTFAHKDISNIEAESDRRSGSQCFAILGFDILIDSDFRPHLIEVNHLPSFGTDTPLDQAIKLKVVQQAMSVLNVSSMDEFKFHQRERRRIQRRLELRMSSAPIEAMGKIDQKQNKSMFEKVSEIYEKFAPEKLGKIDAILSKYEGYEEWLLLRLHKKYESEPSHEIQTDCKVYDHQNSTLSEQNEFEPPSARQDIDFLREKCGLVDMGNYDVLYPPLTNQEMQRLEKMISYAEKNDKKQLEKLMCPLWQSRLQNMEKNSLMYSVPSDDNHNCFCSRGDWLLHGNIHLRRTVPSNTKIAAPPSQKRVEAAARLSKGYSSEDRSEGIGDVTNNCLRIKTNDYRLITRKNKKVNRTFKTEIKLSKVVLELGQDTLSQSMIYYNATCAEFIGRKLVH